MADEQEDAISHLKIFAPKMPKRKNTSHHNQNRKDHRNGIKQPDKNSLSTNGTDDKILRNAIYSKKYNQVGREKYSELYGEQE